MVKLPLLIRHILSIPVKPFGCGYAALRLSWLKIIQDFSHVLSLISSFRLTNLLIVKRLNW